ncbi:MAG: hypothetical protein E7007_03485 [Alphaproteobacteria bacterium]|nr:hypothetical protein [Alphaproteobacteria bacterium]
MAVWLRVLANPRVLKRFLGTRAGKKAALKYGSMLLNSRMAQNAIGKFINRNGDAMKNDKEYKQQLRDYARLQKRVEKLESQLDRARDNNDKMSELTFTLGRNVVEMQRLLAQMQTQYQSHMQQMQIAMANARTR